LIADRAPNPSEENNLGGYQLSVRPALINRLQQSRTVRASATSLRGSQNADPAASWVQAADGGAALCCINQYTKLSLSPGFASIMGRGRDLDYASGLCRYRVDAAEGLRMTKAAIT
jgi:hypothetical protein